ncbi:MAG: hypothetical protein GEU94_11405 [Micromonosporaceae bacterium]|nr:hypothetical protein [Micromonosporaceae bacterium]
MFGADGAQRTQDTEWIAYAGRRGWAALTKNRHIRYNTAERDAVAEHGLVLFALANGNLGFEAMSAALLTAMPKIHEVCGQRPGGSIWIVHRDGAVEPQWP